MKKIFVIVIYIITSCHNYIYAGQSVYLNIRERYARSTETIWQNWRGSKDKNIFKAMLLDIDIRNTQLKKGKFTVEWYFFCKRTSGSDKWIFDFGSREIELDKGEMINIQIRSDTVKSRDEKYYSYYRNLYSHYKKGIKIRGYIVYVRGNKNDILDFAGSSRDLYNLAKDPDKVKKLVADMEK